MQEVSYNFLFFLSSQASPGTGKDCYIYLYRELSETVNNWFCFDNFKT